MLATSLVISSRVYSQEVKFSLFETSDGIFYDDKKLTQFSIHERGENLYVLVQYEADGKNDIFRVLKEDLKYLNLALEGKHFIFKRDGRFYRGKYTLGYDSGIFIDGKVYVRPILVLDRPRIQIVDAADNDDMQNYHHMMFNTESEVEVDYEFIEGYDTVVTVDELDLYTPVTKEDISSLLSKVVTLDLGYSKTQALIVDIGKSRNIDKDVGLIERIDEETEILFVPIPTDSDKIISTWYANGDLSMPVYFASIFALNENYEITSSNQDILTKFNPRGAFCFAPYKYGSSEFVKFRYNFLNSFKLSGSFSAPAREKLGTKTSIDISDRDALSQYASDIRELLKKSSVKTVYLGSEVRATAFVDIDKHYRSWMSIYQSDPVSNLTKNCYNMFGK